ncbi:DUF1700 domain-containing protein [Lentilactobacillus sunkii]|uniref:Integral membrane protein n=1 Tax=Lentilactobacillus sunkii DSM 19904 TaxID=1423808 RepID=A0A0R1KWM4_9LACO|nr:DUF1700 domain-containing protein [Lentilactobacillus sunkii]KRK87813.1 hypothetical protein FD17_GL000753 [Lentilactobacillus sunkii DSM 19904]
MNDFIEEFRALLGQLSPEERDEAVDFYTEYLQDGGYDSYDDCVRELGTPHQLARKVLADYSIRTLNEPASDGSRKKQPKNDVKTIWLIVLAVLSTPVTIPLALGIFGLSIGIFVTAFGVIVGLLGLLFGVMFGGLGSLVVGIGVLPTDAWLGLLYTGTGLMIVGLIVMMTPVFSAAFNGVIRGVTNFSRWAYRKLVPKNRAEKHGRGPQQ